MRSLTLVSGAAWPMSPRARAWLAREPQLVRIEVVAPGSEAQRTRFPALPEGAGEADLAAVADDGRLWRGPAAWVMALWALRGHRGTAIELTRTAREGEARRIVEGLARNLCCVPPRRSLPQPPPRTPVPPPARPPPPTPGVPQATAPPTLSRDWRSAAIRAALEAPQPSPIERARPQSWGSALYRIAAFLFLLPAVFLLVVDLIGTTRFGLTIFLGLPLTLIGSGLLRSAMALETRIAERNRNRFA